MKVLYISHFREGSGWGYHAQNNMLALDAAGVEVAARCVNLKPVEGYVNPRILELENNSAEGITHVIQHVLPHYMEYTSEFPNIGFHLNDTQSLVFPIWKHKLSLMNEVWCPNINTEQVLSMILDSPARVVPIPCDTKEYDRTYEKMNLGKHNGSYIFYVIADLSTRKNLKDTIRAFHTEFSRNEPVSLLIKISKFGMTPTEVMNIVSQEAEKIRVNLKLYPNAELYNREIIIAGELSREEILGIHETGDCYINTSHGESWSMPMFDAYAMGNSVVCEEDAYDYVKDGYFYQAYTDDVFGYNDTFHELGSAREGWNTPYVSSLRIAMRKAYRDNKVKQRRDVSRYSHENVGEYMKRSLAGEINE